jgi:PAS domain S-box-containing protein
MSDKQEARRAVCVDLPQPMLSTRKSESMDLEIATGRQAQIYARMAYLSRTAAGVSVAVGIIVLMGWAVDIGIVKSLGPNLASMKANTALSISLAGISLWFLVDQSRSKWKSRLGYGCATLLLLIGILTLCEMVFSVDLGIDQLLFPEAVLSSNTFSTNRMGGNTAACITLIGLSLLLIDLRIWRARISQSVALVSGVISLFAVVGYVFSVQALYTMHLFAGMAIHTAITLLILSLGILLARPRAGFMSTVSLDDPSGLLVRRLLPIAVVLPTFAGWLRWEGQKFGYIDTATGIIIFATFDTIVLIGFTYVGVVLLSKLVNQVRQSEEKLGLMISGVKDYAILMLDSKGYITSWNMGAERIKGYQSGEIIGQHFSKFYTPEAQAENHLGHELEEAVKQGRYEEEGWRVRKDGTRFFANVIITAIRDQNGNLVGFSKVTRVITEHKEASDALFFEKERAQVTLNSIGDGVIGHFGKYHFPKPRRGENDWLDFARSKRPAHGRSLPDRGCNDPQSHCDSCGLRDCPKSHDASTIELCAASARCI